MNNYNSEQNNLQNRFLEDYFKNNKKSGFFDLSKTEFCKHPEHNPPTHIHIPQGQGYRHICPNCGKETILIPPQISL